MNSAVATVAQVVGQDNTHCRHAEGRKAPGALVANVDIAFISLSQKPVIKAGPLYAFLRGKVIKIACNAVVEQEANAFSRG